MNCKGCMCVQTWVTGLWIKLCRSKFTHNPYTSIISERQDVQWKDTPTVCLCFTHWIHFLYSVLLSLFHSIHTCSIKLHENILIYGIFQWSEKSYSKKTPSRGMQRLDLVFRYLVMWQFYENNVKKKFFLRAKE
jgi:hypothetical protein